MTSAARIEAPALDFAYRDFPLLQPSETVREALHKFRSRGITHKIIYFYVVDENQRLLGVLPTRLLLTADLDTPVKDIYVRKSISLPFNASLGEAREAFSKHQFLAFPIVDASNRFLGVIDIQHFAGKLDNLHERTDFDDIYELMGFQAELSEAASAFGNFRMRFPWLISTIIAGSIGAYLMSHYAVTLRAQIALAFFLTMILGLNESVCIQSATLAMQRLHAGTPSFKTLMASLFKETQVALMLGSVCSITVAGVVLLLRHDRLAALSISLSLVLTILVSCFWGTVIPPLLRRLQKDPKVAAAPLALGLSDVTTLAIYLCLASRIFGIK
jgi:magnesium transporter